MEKKSTRNSNFELLRIIAIFFIIMSHFCVHSGFGFNSQLLMNNIFLRVFTLGHLGTDLFILIFGYFSISTIPTMATIRKKAIKLLSQVWFYSVSIYFLTVIFGTKNIHIKEFIHALLPTTFSVYWFFTPYIVVFLFSPFINTLFLSLDRHKQNVLAFLLFILYCLIPTITQQLPGEGTGEGKGSIATFVMLYTLGAWIRISDYSFLKSIKIGTTMTILFFGTHLFLCAVGEGVKTFPFNIASVYFNSRNSIIIIGLAVGILLIAANGKERCYTSVNTIASMSFGVYLLHDNVYMRKLIWIDLFKNASFIDSPFLLLRLVLLSLVVYSVCLGVELVRKRLFNWLTILIDQKL